MKTMVYLVVGLFLLASAITACGTSGDALATADAATIQAKATEVPFEPTQAWIVCSPFAHMGNAVFLWERAGLRPVDSSSTSNTGRDVGVLKECTPVKLLDRQWSVYDEEFYYLVEGEEQRGWVSESFIAFEEPPHPQPTPSSGE
jgi:hypothetical protein